MKVRAAEKGDIPEIINLMRQFAAFDGTTEEVTLDQDRLSEAYFSSRPELYCLVSLIEDNIVGFLNYFISFSSFELTSTVWIEDVFIIEKFRGKGIGKSLFQKIQEIAIEKECCRIEWLVRRNNHRGIDFYNKIGADVDDDTIYVKWRVGEK